MLFLLYIVDNECKFHHPAMKSFRVMERNVCVNAGVRIHSVGGPVYVLIKARVIYIVYTYVVNSNVTQPSAKDSPRTLESLSSTIAGLQLP